ncbi:MAG: calcium-translocating P-type ATPase, SERCA-type [Candidatus Kariarchaeaceae archaeon]
MSDQDLTSIDLHKPFHSMKKSEVLKELDVDEHGLTTTEVGSRNAHFGTNTIEESEKETIFDIFIAQFKDVLIIILIIAAIVSGVIGYLEDEGFTDAILISVILIINAIMGVYQEWKADKAIEALKEMVTQTTRVIRDDKEIEIKSSELVPGDIVLFEQGDRIPADARLLETINLRTEEAQLTGESLEIQKNSNSVFEENSALGDRMNSVYMGTHVTFGKGKAVVTRIGMGTEMGKIAESVQEINKDPTPTQVRLDKFGQKLSIIIIALMVFMVAYGTLVSGIEFTHMLIIAVSLAVAAIPEGLAIVITLALALGTQRMAKHNAIVKKLPAVESLGSITTVCTDKTGTLTLNQMTVRKLVIFENDGPNIVDPEEYDSLRPHDGNTPDLLIKSALLCNNAELNDQQEIGDPTELALLRVIDTIGRKRNEITNNFSRYDEIPFDSDRKQMTVFVEQNSGDKYAFSKGAPEVLMKRAKYIDLGSGPVDFTDEMKESILQTVGTLADDALRVLGFGYHKFSAAVQNIYELEENIVFIGLMGMIDPPKVGVKEAVDSCNTAGIRVIMVTGDHKKTAMAIAKQIGIASDKSLAVEGVELDSMSDEELDQKISDINVFARISPAHKLRIVRSLKSQGEVVAMTGDGVNDAPALKGADVGIAMGSGTDVTKETADMVLEDDNFTTIVNAIEEGRGIYDNMTKFIRYMLSSNTAEIVVIFLGIIIGLPTPLIAVQILWVNLVTDGVPALALGVDPASEDIMLRPPRDPDESLLSKERVNHIILFGSFMSLVTLGSYILFYTTDLFGTEGDLSKARTIAFSILGFAQFAHAVNVREDTASILNRNFFKNRILIWTVVFSIILQVFIIEGDVILSAISGSEINFLSSLFGTTPLSGYEWLYVSLLASSLVLFAEGLKVIKRNTRFKTIC